MECKKKAAISAIKERWPTATNVEKIVGESNDLDLLLRQARIGDNIFRSQAEIAAELGIGFNTLSRYAIALRGAAIDSAHTCLVLTTANYPIAGGKRMERPILVRAKGVSHDEYEQIKKLIQEKMKSSSQFKAAKRRAENQKPLLPVLPGFTQINQAHNQRRKAKAAKAANKKNEQKPLDWDADNAVAWYLHLKLGYRKPRKPRPVWRGSPCMIGDVLNGV